MSSSSAARGAEDRRALDDLFSATYEELRRLASVVRSGQSGETLNPTALVNEAWLKLAVSGITPPPTPLHFKRIAARAMRQVLVDAARRRGTHKRGGDALFVTLSEDLDGAPATADELLRLDAALERLSLIAPRRARIVECRFFGGYDIAETAALLEISTATVTREWRAARAWLALEVQNDR